MQGVISLQTESSGHCHT